MCVLDTPAQCICYNPDGTMLAVGLGGGLETDAGEWRDFNEYSVGFFPAGVEMPRIGQRGVNFRSHSRLGHKAET